MLQNRLVNFHTQDYRTNLNGIYGLCSRRIGKIQRDYIDSVLRDTRNISCQCNIIRNYMCTCRKFSRSQARYFTFPNQVYQFPNWRFADIGIGDIKTLPRRRIRKIYLPQTTDRSVGSLDLSSYLSRRSRQRLADSYYDNKRTSSKCVGDFIKNENISLSNKKLSPKVQKKSGSTSPNCGSSEKDKSSVGYNIQKDAAAIPTQTNTNLGKTSKARQSQEQVARNNKISKQADVTITRDLLNPLADVLNSNIVVTNSENCKDFSSESFVQHVHNLENPSEEKQSKVSVDQIENKLIGEYKEMGSSKSKDRPSIERPVPEFKSASLLRRRFEALRRGLCRKESKKESVLLKKLLSYISAPSRKDVSITSHPPHLQGRSYWNTTINKPFPKPADDYKAYNISTYSKISKVKKCKDNRQWLTDAVDNDEIQEMNKLSRNKLDDEYINNSPKLSNDISRNTKQEMKSQCSSHVTPKKKQGRKFFFFRNKSKEKEIKLLKPKKGITTGRYEVKDGLMVKVGDVTENHKTKKEQVEIREKSMDQRDGSDLLRRAWLEKLVTSTEDSRNNVHIRWNNKMYAPSSSTVLELIDSVYKHTGIRSRSATTTKGSTNYRSFTKQRLHFMKQNIEAWMLPKTIRNMQKRTNKKVNYSQDKCTKHLPAIVPSQKWFVDASKELSPKVEFVLHAIPNSASSEYVIIGVLDNYFSRSNSNELPFQSSDEKIYNIVEYETTNFKKGKEKCHMATGDSVTHERRVNDVNLTVNVGNDQYERSTISAVVTEIPTLVRNIPIQTSNVSLQKRCGVIEVGIITQRDIRDGRQPIFKVDDDLSDDESEKNINIQKKCELADSYIQNHYRNWMSSGIDLYSWHQSDFHNTSGNNSVTSHSQGDGSKSSPKMYNDFQESTVVLSSCGTSSCSHCVALDDERKQDDSLKSKILNKLKRNCVSETPLKPFKRDFPKDSLEVFKKRQLYACMKQKSHWSSANSLEQLSSEIKKHAGVCPRTNKPCWRLPSPTKDSKGQKKRVSISGLESTGKLVSQPSDRSRKDLLSSKESGSKQKDVPSSKVIEGLPKSICELPQSPCKESFTEKKPASTKKNAPPRDDLNQKLPKAETLSPCKSPQAKPPSKSPPISVKPKKTKCLCPKNLKKTSSQTTQISRTMSQESGISVKKSPSPKPSNKEKKERNKNRDKVCKADCVNKKKKTPPPSPPTENAKPQPTSTDCLYNNKNKISGLYLKKLAVKKKNCCEACKNWNKNKVIQLNSQEKITIRMNRDTPSTGDIHEDLNIKVQDQDGQTLYEKINCKQAGDRNKCALLKDMYKSHLQRVSTPTIAKNIVAQNNESDVKQKKSDTSIDNLIEINFTLKMKQGDKGTKIDIQDNDDIDVKKNILQEIENQNEVYIVNEKDRAEHVNASENKKDVNIKIVIKNYSNDSDKNNEIETYAIQKTSNDNFTKRISEKFQTVSTAESDVVDHPSRSGLIQGCLCSTLAAKLNLSKGVSTDVCCCRQKIKQEQKIDYDIPTKDCSLDLKTCIDLETQNSKYVSNKINTTNLSTQNRAHSIVVTNAAATVPEGTDKIRVPANDECDKTFIRDISNGNNKCRYTSSFKREKVSGLSQDETFIPNSNFVKKAITEPHRDRMSKCARNSHADILQMNEIKKAVLEMYAEKIVSNEGDTKIVAKLPKFDLDTENNIFNYVAVLKGRKRVSERNIVMMSVKR